MNKSKEEDKESENKLIVVGLPWDKIGMWNQMVIFLKKDQTN